MVEHDRENPLNEPLLSITIASDCLLRAATPAADGFINPIKLLRISNMSRGFITIFPNMVKKVRYLSIFFHSNYL